MHLQHIGRRPLTRHDFAEMMRDPRTAGTTVKWLLREGKADRVRTSPKVGRAGGNRNQNVAHTAKKLAPLHNLLEILSGQLIDRKFCAHERDLLDNVERSIHACAEYIRELERENGRCYLCFPFPRGGLPFSGSVGSTDSMEAIMTTDGP